MQSCHIPSASLHPLQGGTTVVRKEGAAQARPERKQQSAKEVVVRYYEAYNRGDLDTLATLVAEVGLPAGALRVAAAWAWPLAMPCLGRGVAGCTRARELWGMAAQWVDRAGLPTRPRPSNAAPSLPYVSGCAKPISSLLSIITHTHTPHGTPQTHHLFLGAPCMPHHYQGQYVLMTTSHIYTP